eukprot:TRINITY_DN1987_c0_g1_i5.p1 TRINITY_DN1987_c0_g1~~TRINITY_DN1987_c0_g1_i5.p1  ORF type:complete len:565 (+),score=157.58 TRINITY_DN1987_c0_g1_i5:256-1950(+)
MRLYGKTTGLTLLRTRALNIGLECLAGLDRHGEALEEVDNALKGSANDASRVQLAVAKGEVLWNSGELAKAVGYLESVGENVPAVREKALEMKQLYEKVHCMPYGSPAMEKFEAFTAWMKENGTRFSKIEVRYYGPDYRGVHTMKELREEEVFLTIPKSLIITSQKGKETPLGAKVLKASLDLNWDYLVYINIFLLTQFHDPNSFWKPYMDVYPRDVSTFPIFYTKEERKLLQGSVMNSHIDDEIEEVRQEYTKIVQAVPEFKLFTLDEYMRNKTLIISRIFYVTIHNVVDRIMVPLADMFNHHYERLGDTHWRYVDKEEAFVVSAEKTIHKGDPICEHYGEKPNYRFLFYYGFLIEGNANNCVYVKLYFNKDDEQIIEKCNMVGAYADAEIKTFKYFDNYDIEDTHNNKFFSYLRLIEYSGELQAFGKHLIPSVVDVNACNFVRRKLRCPILSIENEKKALLKAKEVATEYLSKYPDSYEKDMELLNQKDLTFNQRNCIVLRSDEKKILMGIMELAELGLKLLNMNNSNKAKEYYEKVGKDKTYAAYFDRVLIPFLIQSNPPT